jgi:hypothetical protein
VSERRCPVSGRSRTLGRRRGLLPNVKGAARSAWAHTLDGGRPALLLCGCAISRIARPRSDHLGAATSGASE